MGNAYDDFQEEVIDCIEEMGPCSREEASRLASEKVSDIRYGCKYRLSPMIVAGAILGINDCCLGSNKPPQ
ncbi:MAG: hypothetical protein JXK04_00365 [Campylobacterales bacterium]|nr:hypothetical protein [Campylobacterales bacterium]